MGTKERKKECSYNDEKKRENNIYQRKRGMTK